MVEQFPLISVVTPSYNQATFIEATIKSVLNQDYPNLQYIIIDGGSDDGSREIIERYQEHLYFWCSEPDQGQYDAINKGFSHASGQIMTWLNSDDMLCPWALRTIASVMIELPQIKWLSTLCPAYWDYHSFCSNIGVTNGYSLEAFLDGYYLPPIGGKAFIQQESTFWNRELWNQAGSYLSTDLKLASDFDLWCRFFQHTDLYGIASPLGGFRRQHFQKSRNMDLYSQEAVDSLNKLRKIKGWKPHKVRKTLLKLKVDQIPKARKYLKLKVGYVGKRIYRMQKDNPKAYWTVEEYRYL
ncbi:glycosyltransferase [Nodosilinea sp. LEGE 06152]|uniref:glycosyltransferase family 2 protein n=1 Tax=Nodosilinea sp. LEGE 06152 TaxID=2777966 RepID=UPI00187F9151|nr:glycosyltransferase family 2 protein [Nodosilinea sp. LEGE 06152]MBE9158415.1 glycosyltransferase [Nodosilinea sp. LEGE 06152]